MLIITFVFYVIKVGFWNRKLELVFACLMCLLLPFAMGFVYFMAPNAPFSTLMLYAYCSLYILLLALAETVFAGSGERKKRPNKSVIGMIVASITVVGIVYCCYLIDAQAYFRTSIAYERATSYYNRIISRVEEMDGYQYGDSLAILGDFYYKTNPSPIEIRLFNDDENIRTLDGVALENGLITSGVRNNFIRTYIGFDTGFVSDEDKNKISETTEYKNMPIYPAEGSIAKIRDVWVVKLCE